MTKELKRQYYHLDLPFHATEEEVKSKQKAMIKILRAKKIYNGKDTSVEITKTQRAGEEILNYLKNNGVPKKLHRFETEGRTLLSQLFVLALVAVVVIAGFASLI